VVQAIKPFLMFEGQAEEAMNLYVSLFPDASILEISRYGPGEAGPEGSVHTAAFSIAGLTIMYIDSPVNHDFSFTPAMSLFVDMSSEDELQSVAAALAEGGTVLMPLGDYGFSRQFTWVNDRYGVSWQLNLP